MTDIAIIETGSGGDFILNNSDLEAVQGIENLPYLCMFGGSYWIFNEDMPANQQFKSQTESALMNNPLTSAGRIEIEKAINADLQIITQNMPGSTVTLDTQIVANNKLSIIITLNGKVFQYEWNPSSRFLNYVI